MRMGGLRDVILRKWDFILQNRGLYQAVYKDTQLTDKVSRLNMKCML